MRAKLINEKFTPESDPIHDMGIGVSKIVRKFEKELKEELEWLNEENNIFRYIPGENLIQIDCFPISNEGLKDLYRIVDKIIKKYNIFKIVFKPQLWDLDTNNCFLLIKII